MPSKRRTPAKALASAAAKAASVPPKDTPPQPTKAVPAPPPQPPLPPPPPPQPVESSATKVRREWQKFITDWYEPQQKKIREQIQKELATKYKKSGSLKTQQKARDSEFQQKISKLALQLAEPARIEWEKRLEAAQLREDEWDDMTSEEQQAVLSVFVGLFGDEEEGDSDDAANDQYTLGNASSIGEDEFPTEDQYKVTSSKPSPPMPSSVTFELVNPSSLFVEMASPPILTKSLPSLSMDNLATFGASNVGRPAEPASSNPATTGGFGFQNWASEAGLSLHPPLSQASKSAPRPRATDNISRQASAMSTISSPPLFSNQPSPPQSSPPTQIVKASPLTTTDALPLGKRYIGPTILDDEETLDEDLLKSKMAAEYEEFRNSLRIQMIYDFHAEAAEIEIKLVETLLADEGTKESRARAKVVQEHEMHMMALREQKEEERKKRCAEERDRRREELKAYLARTPLRSPQHRDDDPSGWKGAPSKSSNKSAPQKGRSAAQKENLPVPQLSASSSGSAAKSEPPGILKKSASALSQAEASSNEAIFAQAAARLAQAIQTADGPNVPQPSQARKRTNSTRLPNQDIPQITINFADPPNGIPPSTSAPAPAVKGKKAKKGQAAASRPITDELDADAEPPPLPSPWGAPTSKSAWNAPSTSHLKNTFVSDELDPDASPGIFSTLASSFTSAWTGTTKNPSGTLEKKSKTVTFMDEPDVEPDVPPISTWGAKPQNGAWGSVNGKQKKATVMEDQKQRGPAPSPPSASGGKKPVKASAAPTTKRPKAVVVSEELEGMDEDGMLTPSPPQTLPQTKGTKTAWGPTSAKQTKAATPPAGTQPPRRMESSTSKSARVETVLDPYDAWETAGASASANMPGTLDGVDILEESDDEDDDGWLDKENAEYWNNFIGVEPEKESAEVPTKHVRWTPTRDCDSDEEGESGEFGDKFAGELWMQYAISGGEAPELDTPTAAPEVVQTQKTKQETGLWEKGKMKKGGGPIGEGGKPPSIIDRAAIQGTPWPKMESWLSSATRVGQSSSSARFL
ncbi:hypothetical protein J3A83DRAFT_4370917 [Scleroderma citrinum]